jgi:hypothetical protein
MKHDYLVGKVFPDHAQLAKMHLVAANLVKFCRNFWNQLISSFLQKKVLLIKIV